MLGNSSFLCLSKVLQNKNINLDLGVVQLAVGLMISGPVLIYAELSGDFPLGDSRQPIYKSLRPFDLVS
ncbi:hypothetical protein B8U65_11200 [Acinetobacter baumannii]|nr:hypothetical protein B8U65_11200 [Acinetobacter baumannii]